MIATTGAYQTMAESLDQVPDYRVTITLPGGVYPDLTLGVKRLEINASTSSDLPDQTRFQVGYPAMECTFTLAGLVDQRDESKTAAWLFGKYPTTASDGSTSPLYQQFVEQSLVTVDLGLQPAGAAGVSELLRKFTGYVAYYQENPDGSVDFTCVDSRTLLRSFPVVPPVVTAPPYNAGLTSEFAVDALLRKASASTVSTWPAQRPSCLLAVGLRASLWPEVGSLVTTAAQPVPTFATGVYGSGIAQATASLTGLSNVTWQTTAALGTTVFVEFWVKGVFFPPFIGIHDAGSLIAGVPLLTLAATSTGLTVTPSAGTLGGPTFTWTTTVDTNAHYVAFKLTLPAAGGTAWSATAYLDGASQASGAMNFTTPRGAPSWNLITAVPQSATIEALQVTTESAPALNNAFSPKAALDPSLNALQVVPEMSGDPWQIIQEVADAEFAVAGFDESGIFRFKNRATLRGAALSRTVTSTMALRALGVESTTASVINRATIPYTPYVYATVASTVWTIGTATRIPKGQTVTLTATVDGLFTNLATTISKLPNGTVDPTASYYRVSYDSAGSSEHPGVTFGAIMQTSANTLTIPVTNPTTRDAWLVSPANYLDVPAGTPLLRIAALAVTPGDALVADFQYPPVSSGGAASTRWGEVAYQPSSSQWLQDPDSATQLAQDIVVDSCIPRPNLTNVSIIPDPRLQLSDVVRIVDSDRTGVDEYARIFAWTLTYEAGSDGGDMTYDMTIDARTLSAPGGWIMGYAGRSEVGATAYVYAAS
jgi:hypothetical protein